MNIIQTLIIYASIQIPPPSYFLTLVLFLFASLLFSGCKKTGDVIKKELPENISKQELLLWINNYQKLMPGGPKPILEQTQKTYYRGQMILKMPLSSGGGNLYFTKTDDLEVQFIRIVSADNQINTPFNGYYEFIDMKTYSYKKLNFKNGIKTNSILNIEFKYQELIQSNSLIKSSSWLGDLLYCISRYIIAVPRSAELGGGCWVFSPGGNTGNPVLNPGQVEVPPIGDSGGSEIEDIDWFNWFLYLNYPHSSPSPPDGLVNVGQWSPYPSGGDGESYPSNPPEENLLQPIFDNLPPLIIWEFEGDDGTSFIDNAPNIEPPLDFHPMDLSYIKFPKFVNLVKNLRSFVKGNPKVLNALQKWSGFSKQEILDKLIFRLGSGPEILVSDAVGPNYGKYNHQNARGVLLIDPITVNNFQQAQQSSKEEDALAFMLSIIILHEFTHFGVNSMGLSNSGRFKFAETGREFERMLFDVILIDGPNGNLNEVYIEFVRK